MRLFRRRRRLEELDEAQAYARTLPQGDVKTIRLPPRRPRDARVLEGGELLRRAFLDRLERREHGHGGS